MSVPQKQEIDVAISPGDPPEKNLSPQNQDNQKPEFKPVKYKREQTEDGTTRFTFERFQEGLDAFLQALARSTGVNDADFALTLIHQVVSATSRRNDKRAGSRNAATASLMDIEPQDSLEGMLSAQLVATHHQAMESLRMANQAKYPDKRTVCQNQAVKLMRLYTAQLEALEKYRRKGRTTLTIQRKG